MGQVNPAAFQKAATADDEGLDVLREHVGLLKKVCRQKAVYCLKDVRRQVGPSGCSSAGAAISACASCVACMPGPAAALWRRLGRDRLACCPVAGSLIE